MDAAHEALAAWRGGMQLGGGVNLRNAVDWLERNSLPVDLVPKRSINRCRLEALGKVDLKLDVGGCLGALGYSDPSLSSEG